MRVALLSDIHGNSVALKAVLQKLKEAGIKKLLIMGDFVGYYYDHDKVLALLSEFDWEGVCGNHDNMLAAFISGEKRQIEEYRTSFGKSLDVALKKLTEDQIKMILSLPEKREVVINNKKILICHGSPWNINDYIYPDSPTSIFQRLARLGYDFVFLGNTHYPMVKKVSQTLIINPGSVGQPRDYGSNTSWAIVDFKAEKVNFYRTKFEPKKIIEQVKKNDPKIKYLIQVLLREKSKYVR